MKVFISASVEENKKSKTRQAKLFRACHASHKELLWDFYQIQRFQTNKYKKKLANFPIFILI